MKRIPTLASAAFLALSASAALAQVPTGFPADLLPKIDALSPDRSATPAPINSATLNAAITVPLGYGQAMVGWNITGLTASGAALTPEFTNDPTGVAGWTATAAIKSGARVATLTTDGPALMFAAPHSFVRLRVSIVGTGNVTGAWNASVGAPESVLGVALTPVVAAGPLTLTTGNSSQALAAAGTATRFVMIANPSTATQQGIVTAESIFFTITGVSATMTAGAGSFELLPGDRVVLMVGISTAINWIAATTGHKITAVVN